MIAQEIIARGIQCDTTAQWNLLIAVSVKSSRSDWPDGCDTKSTHIHTMWLKHLDWPSRHGMQAADSLDPTGFNTQHEPC